MINFSLENAPDNLEPELKDYLERQFNTLQEAILSASDIQEVNGVPAKQENGMLRYVATTDATFTSTGFWGLESGTWVKISGVPDNSVTSAKIVNGEIVADDVDLTEVMTHANVPCFSVYMGSTQTLSLNTYTLLNFNTKLFDTHSFYNVTLKQFKPTIAGYYLINAHQRFTASPLVTAQIALDKNGTTYYAQGSKSTEDGGTYEGLVSTGSAVIYLNGSTDYVDIHGYMNGTATRTASSGVYNTGFSGHLVARA